MSDSEASDAGRPKRPSARRAKPDADDRARVSAATPEAKPKRVRPSAEKRKVSASTAVTRPAIDAGQEEIQEMERDLESLLQDVRHVGEDHDARQRAADAISSIATRLTPDANTATSDSAALLPKARQYLSTAFYLKQWGERGMRNRADRVDDFGLDRTYEASLRPFFELMANKYFRVEIEGVGNIPNEGRALLIGNHSGTLPWDGVMLKTALRQKHPVARELRWLVEDYVYHAPFLGAFVNRVGAVRACQENAERLLQNEELVAVFPEGIKGIAKRYSDRYKLQRFGRGGYIKLALRTGTPVIPVAVIGAEETYPLLHMVKAFSKLLGMPFLPVTPTFPWLGPLGLAPLPSRWKIVIGTPVRELEGHGPDDARDEVLVGELNQRVRGQVERLVESALESRGRHVFV